MGSIGQPGQELQPFEIVILGPRRHTQTSFGPNYFPNCQHFPNNVRSKFTACSMLFSLMKNLQIFCKKSQNLQIFCKKSQNFADFLTNLQRTHLNTPSYQISKTYYFKCGLDRQKLKNTFFKSCDLIWVTLTL